MIKTYPGFCVDDEREKWCVGDGEGISCIIPDDWHTG